VVLVLVVLVGGLGQMQGVVAWEQLPQEPTEEEEEEEEVALQWKRLVVEWHPTRRRKRLLCRPICRQRPSSAGLRPLEDSCAAYGHTSPCHRTQLESRWEQQEGQVVQVVLVLVLGGLGQLQGVPADS
jgi:hypothetical protein